MRPGWHRGTVALVTGGGTGIGRATALDLARGGADVVICGRRPEPLEKTAAEIEALGVGALAVPADIRDEDQAVHLVDAALKRFGRIDTLVNNAGGQFSAPAEQITTKGWRAVHDLAVDATWSVTREVAVRAMIPQRSGVIFFLAFSPRRGIASMVHASSARAALENLAAGLAMEWSRFGIRTVCIAPGTIATDGLRAALFRGRPGPVGGRGADAPLRDRGRSLRCHRLSGLTLGRLRHRHHGRRRRRCRRLGDRPSGAPVGGAALAIDATPPSPKTSSHRKE